MNLDSIGYGLLILAVLVFVIGYYATGRSVLRPAQPAIVIAFLGLAILLIATLLPTHR